jgi:hypothetical protein
MGYARLSKIHILTKRPWGGMSTSIFTQFEFMPYQNFVMSIV